MALRCYRNIGLGILFCKKLVEVVFLIVTIGLLGYLTYFFLSLPMVSAEVARKPHLIGLPKSLRDVGAERFAFAQPPRNGTETYGSPLRGFHTFPFVLSVQTVFLLFRSTLFP